MCSSAPADELAAWRTLFQVEGGPVPTPASARFSLEAERKRSLAAALRLAFLEVECGKLQQTLQQYLAASQAPRSTLVDPAINALYIKLSCDLKAAEARAKQLEEENHALQFAPNAPLGRRLLSRCRQLLAENEALGIQTGEGRVAALEAALTVERSITQEARQALAEAQSGALALDEELERIQMALVPTRKRRRDEDDKGMGSEGKDGKGSKEDENEPREPEGKSISTPGETPHHDA